MSQQVWKPLPDGTYVHDSIIDGRVTLRVDCNGEDITIEGSEEGDWQTINLNPFRHRLCTLTTVPDAPSVSAPVEVIKAIETLMIKAAGGHKPPYDAPLYEWEKPTEFYIVEKWLERTKEGE